MTPSVFEGLEAVDETSFCVEMEANAEQALMPATANIAILLCKAA
ncbi:hypothetical protein [Methylobacter sp.]